MKDSEASGPRRFRPLRVVAEVSIIVVGVLIALAAEGWREAASDRALTRTYLAGLSADLRLDSADYVRFLKPNYLPAQAVAADSLIVILGDSTVVVAPATTLRFLRELLYLLSATKSRATFDDMVSSGRLGLIDDPNLRGSLVQYYASSVVENPEAYQAYLNSSFFPFTQELTRVLGPVRFSQMASCDSRSGVGAESLEAYLGCFETAADGDELQLLRGEPGLVALVANQLFQRFFGLRGVSSASAQASALLRQLESQPQAP
jgi:hypothetical protein